MSNSLTLNDDEWNQFECDGYLKLGKVLANEELRELQERIDAIMLGQAEAPYDRMMMQLDSSTGKYDDAGEQSIGFKGATLNYRKIQGLELDPVFLNYVQRPIFRDICSRLLGLQTDVSVFRAMFMNKPAQQGTWLPWHQDRWNFLDRDPLITVWTALDPATKLNGCVQIVPGSHKYGVINPTHHSAFLTAEQTVEHVLPDNIVWLELEPGEVVLLHNWLLHASDVNRSSTPRRAFSACYMDAATKSQNDERFQVVFRSAAREPNEASCLD